MSDADFMAMATGQADAMKLFSTGKLKISGDVMASQKLGFLEEADAGDGARRDQEAHRRAVAARSARCGRGVPADYAPTDAPTCSRRSRSTSKQNPELAAKINTIYQWKICDQRVDARPQERHGQRQGTARRAATCTLELTEDDFLDMTQGKADAMKLFTTGKLKITGNVMASQKLNFLSKLDPSKAIEVIAKRRGAVGRTGGRCGCGGGAAPKAQAQAPKILRGPHQAPRGEPGPQKEVRATVEFVVDGSSRRSRSAATTRSKVDATLTITDADLVALVTGKATAKTLYQYGKLRVDGDVCRAHRLGFLKGLV